MGYVIKEQIRKAQVTIPSGNVTTLDSNPYLVISETGGFPTNNYTILAAQISTNDIATVVSGFGHLYLQYDNSQKIAVYDENLGSIQANFRPNFIINMSHPPNTFGSNTLQNLTRDLRISSENAGTIINGNGEIIVTVYYIDNF